MLVVYMRGDKMRCHLLPRIDTYVDAVRVATTYAQVDRTRVHACGRHLRDKQLSKLMAPCNEGQYTK